MTSREFDFRRPPPGDLEKRVSDWIVEACTLAPPRWVKHIPAPIELELIRSETVTASVAVERLGELAIAFRVQPAGGEPALVLAMNRPLLLALIGAAFGEIYESLPVDRDLTSVEDSVCSFLVEQLFLNILKDAWPLKEPLNWSIGERGIPKNIVTIPPNEPIVLSTLNVIGSFDAQPVFFLWPRQGLIERLAPARIVTAPPGPADRERIEALVREMAVDVSVILGTADVTMLQLAEMQPGDVVLLEQKITEPLTARIASREKFRVWPGAVGRRQAIQVAGIVKE